MVSAAEKKIMLYASLLTTLLLNMFKLLALRDNSFAGRYWTFNGYELLFQFAWNFFFCLSVGYNALQVAAKLKKKRQRAMVLILSNAGLIILFVAAGVFVQKRLFLDAVPDKIFRFTYTLRLLISQAALLLFIRIYQLTQQRNSKQSENQQLRNAYLSAQLELLKEQLNPHFFLNALTSLSAVIREDSRKAQQYIYHLSRIFRYSLESRHKSIVTLQEEINMLQSYMEIMKMRLGNNIIFLLQIKNESLHQFLPYMSLQPLLENVLKHNSASAEAPVEITITSEKNSVSVINKLQPVYFKNESTGIGLHNLQERYKILMNKEIEIIKTGYSFTVTLPLTEHEN